MIFGHVLSHLDLILRNLIFQHHEKWPKRAGISRFPWTSEFLVRTIRKSIKNNVNWCRELIIWLTWARDIVSQRGVQSADWRTPPEPIWRPLVTWRRVLRTTLDLIRRPDFSQSPVFRTVPEGGGRRPSPPEDFSGLVQTYDFSSCFTVLFEKRTFLCWRRGGWGWVSRWRLNARAFSFGKTSTFASLELRPAFS